MVHEVRYAHPSLNIADAPTNVAEPSESDLPRAMSIPPKTGFYPITKIS